MASAHPHPLRAGAALAIGLTLSPLSGSMNAVAKPPTAQVSTTDGKTFDGKVSLASERNTTRRVVTVHETGSAKPRRHNDPPKVSGVRSLAIARQQPASRKPSIPRVKPRQIFIPECYGPNNEFLCAPPTTPTTPRPTTSPTRRPTPQTPAWTYAKAEQIIRRVDVNLILPDPTINIGPDPSTNEWNMAVVGYPLWLWTTTPTTITHTATHDGLTFTLTGHRTHLTLDMGDGTTITCTQTTPYDDTLEPGTPSPTCGHTYQTPSLPQTRYTIHATSTWNVTWTTLNYTGTLPGHTTATRTLPVGELQSLIRR